MQELNQNILPTIGETEPTDQVKKLMCLEFATRNTDIIDPISFAKEMYEWVKESKAETWNINSNEVKYTYDLTKGAPPSNTNESGDSQSND